MCKLFDVETLIGHRGSLVCVNRYVIKSSNIVKMFRMLFYIKYVIYDIGLLNFIFKVMNIFMNIMNGLLFLLILVTKLNLLDSDC